LTDPVEIVVDIEIQEIYVFHSFQIRVSGITDYGHNINGFSLNKVLSKLGAKTNKLALRQLEIKVYR
jgi:hypothetical protein